MPLTPGTRLGPYEITGPLGAGGMGEVYQARDTRLERTVAIKVLPSHLAQNADARQRFEREARAVSSLNHPNICTLFDVGEQEGVHYLVMEHLEGETVAERLLKGAMPLADALRAAIQVADALDRAHRQGVVHRDLKPGNIMLTRAGAKLLDFGLAKQGPEAAPPISSVAMTMASPLTAEGTIVGTFQYMSPEQLEGKPADARSDIFSFGAVLFEMLTGRRAFEAKSQASLIAAILEREPPVVSTAQPEASSSLDRVVKTCLAKDPDARFQTAADLRLQLQWLSEPGSAAHVVGPAPLSPRATLLSARIAWSLVIGLGLITTWLAMRGSPGTDIPASRIAASILPPPGQGFDIASTGGLAISPDGTRLVYGARGADGILRLWLRLMDETSARPLPGTEDGESPFWSPDGRSIAFIADGKVRKLDLERSLVETLCETSGIFGGSWGAGGDIVLSLSQKEGLSRISSSGGTPPALIASPENSEDSHLWPSFLPDGRHFLYHVRSYGSEEKQGQIRIASLDGAVSKRLFSSNSNAVYSPTGHIVWWNDGNLKAQRFDPDRLEMVGEAFPLAADVAFNPRRGFAAFAISGQGRLVYQQGAAVAGDELVLVDRAGRELGKVGPRGNFYSPRLSPDGRQVALDISGETNQGDIWLLDVERGSATRFSFFQEDDSGPIWSPDGAEILFHSSRGGARVAIYARPMRGGAEARLLVADPETNLTPADWSRDGLVLLTRGSRGKEDLWVYSMKEGRSRPWVATPFREFEGSIAPDGRHVAYVSDETGRFEIYVQTFPVAGERWSVSSGGGIWPMWRPDGTELFYVTDDEMMMAVPVRGIERAALEFGEPVALFRAAFKPNDIRQYDTRDGERFLVNRSLPVGADVALTLILNWPLGLDK